MATSSAHCDPAPQTTALELLETRLGLQLYSLENTLPEEISLHLTEGRDSDALLTAVISHAMAASSSRLVIENDYTDFIWRDEYASFYAGLFRDYGSACRRIHFFDSTAKTVVSMLEDGEATKYRGFSVLRPTIAGIVGRTVLESPGKEEVGICIPCHGNFRTHLLGRPLSVKGFPFIQQDTQVMRCAQACLLMSMLFLQHTSSEALSLPHEISQVATREFIQLGRPFPSVGLLPSEINHFLSRVGYGPLRYDNPPRDEFGFDELAFVPYLQSGIPTLLLSDNHAVVAIGFNLGQERKSTGLIASISDFVTSIIVHDDGRSPYKNIPRSPLGRPSEDESHDAEVTAFNDLSVLKSFIIPCPKKMYLRASLASSLVKAMLEQPLFQACVAARAAQRCPGAQVFTDIMSGGGTTGDCIVISSKLMKAEFFKSLCLARRPLLDSVLFDHYMEMRMPRLIWLVEITSSRYLFDGSRSIFGELILDATGSARAMPLVAGHLPGVIFSAADSEDPAEVADLQLYPSWSDTA